MSLPPLPASPSGWYRLWTSAPDHIVHLPHYRTPPEGYATAAFVWQGDGTDLTRLPQEIQIVEGNGLPIPEAAANGFVAGAVVLACTKARDIVLSLAEKDCQFVKIVVRNGDTGEPIPEPAWLVIPQAALHDWRPDGYSADGLMWEWESISVDPSALQGRRLWMLRKPDLQSFIPNYRAHPPILIENALANELRDSGLDVELIPCDVLGEIQQESAKGKPPGLSGEKFGKRSRLIAKSKQIDPKHDEAASYYQVKADILPIYQFNRKNYATDWTKASYIHIEEMIGVDLEIFSDPIIRRFSVRICESLFNAGEYSEKIQVLTSAEIKRVLPKIFLVRGLPTLIAVHRDVFDRLNAIASEDVDAWEVEIRHVQGEFLSDQYVAMHIKNEFQSENTQGARRSIDNPPDVPGGKLYYWESSVPHPPSLTEVRNVNIWRMRDVQDYFFVSEAAFQEVFSDAGVKSAKRQVWGV